MKTWKTQLIINSFLGNQEMAMAGNEEKALQSKGGNNFKGGSAIPAGPCPLL